MDRLVTFVVMGREIQATVRNAASVGRCRNGVERGGILPPFALFGGGFRLFLWNVVESNVLILFVRGFWATVLQLFKEPYNLRTCINLRSVEITKEVFNFF